MNSMSDSQRNVRDMLYQTNIWVLCVIKQKILPGQRLTADYVEQHKAQAGALIALIGAGRLHFQYT